jgi:hypoxanthine phosphoribosyltransferase
VTSRPGRAAGQAVVKPLFSKEDIEDRTMALAAEIAAHEPAPLMLVAIKEGGVPFGDLLSSALAAQGLSVEVATLGLSSYREDTISSGKVSLTEALSRDIKARNVILVDDILETGKTLSFAADHLRTHGARGIRTCVLLDKPHAARTHQADHVGFACPDLYVVGFGLDLAGRYRDLPFVGVLPFGKD